MCFFALTHLFSTQATQNRVPLKHFNPWSTRCERQSFCITIIFVVTFTNTRYSSPTLVILLVLAPGFGSKDVKFKPCYATSVIVIINVKYSNLIKLVTIIFVVISANTIYSSPTLVILFGLWVTRLDPKMSNSNPSLLQVPLSLLMSNTVISYNWLQLFS